MRSKLHLIGLCIALLMGVLIGRMDDVASALASIAHTGIPDRQGLIHTCFLNKTGIIRVINPSAQHCTSTEGKLVWHQGAFSTPGPTTSPTSVQSPAPTILRATGQVTVPKGKICSTLGMGTPPDVDPFGTGKNQFCTIASIAVSTQPIAMSIFVKTNSGVVEESPYAYRLIWKDGLLSLFLPDTEDSVNAAFAYSGTFAGPLALTFTALYPSGK